METEFGLVPDHWRIANLDEVAVVQTGVAKGRDLTGSDLVEVPYLRVANVQDGHLDLREMKHIKIRRSESGRYVLRPGDVLLTEGGDFDKLGRGFIWRDEIPGCVHQNHVFAVRPRVSLLLPEFLAYLVQSPYGRAYFLRVAHKTTNLACINTTKLKAFPVLLPPLEEQAQIASVCAFVQRAATVEGELETSASRLKAGGMRGLFTRGLRGEMQKETEIGLVPESWHIARLGDLAKIGNGTTPNRTDPRYWNGGTIPWVTSGRMYERRISGSDVLVTTTALAETSLPLLPPGTVLIAIVGEGKTLGHCAILDVEATTSRHVGFVQLRGQLLPEFLVGILESRYHYLRQLASGNGSTRAALTGALLKGVPVPVPGIDEQREIVTLLQAFDQKIDLHRKKLKVLDELFKSLLDKLMNGEIRVGDLDLSALAASPKPQAAV